VAKRKRRTKAEIERIREGLYEILAEHHPQSVRQVFYQAVTRGLVAKTEAEYKRTVCRLLTRMRFEGVIPFAWISDFTRWQRKPTTYNSLSEALRFWADSYRRALWIEQPVHVEFWLEKDALAGIVYQETSRYDVPLMVSRGFSSNSFLYTTAQDIQQEGKPAYIYMLGDFDPSGEGIMAHISQRLKEFAPAAEIYCERLAVTEEQIRLWDLPTRPTKLTDSRAKRFGHSESVELDSIPAPLLRRLVREAIERHIDGDVLIKTLTAEESERRLLEVLPHLAKNGNGLWDMAHKWGDD